MFGRGVGVLARHGRDHKFSKCLRAQLARRGHLARSTVLQLNSLCRLVERVIALRHGSVYRGRAAAGGLP